jgi:hypothetical protein
MSFDSAAALARGALVVDDIWVRSSKNEKGHWLGLFPRQLPLLDFSPKPSGGAGYGDLNNNGK